MRLLSLILIFCCAGCSALEISTDGDTESIKSSDIQADQALDYSVKVKRPAIGTKQRNLTSTGATAETLTLTATANGLTAKIPAGSELEIKSESNSNINETKNSHESSTSIQPFSLPWGVYAAVIALIAGGLFVAFRFSFIWGIPLVLGGVLVYGVFVAVGTYPGWMAIALCIVCAIAAAIYIVHAYRVKGIATDRENKAKTISAFKRAVERTPESAKKAVKESIKHTVGDKQNPERKSYDAEIERA